MALTTPFNTNVASLNSYLPPVWESTFLFYLVLPGLCAFFLFLFVFCVAFKLIKTRKYGTSHDSRDSQRYRCEELSDTCIYEVINDNIGSPVIQQAIESNYEKPYSQNLQVCLPALHTVQGGKVEDTQIQPPLEIPYVLHAPPKGEGHKDQYYDVSGLVSLLDQETFPINDQAHQSKDVCMMHLDNEFLTTSSNQLLLRNHNLLEEYPIYESLDKSWRKKSLDSDDPLGMKINNSNDSGCYGSHGRDMDKYEEETIVGGCQKSKSCIRKISLAKNLKEPYEKVFNNNSGKEVNTCKISQQISNPETNERNAYDTNDVDHDKFDDVFETHASHAFCKLSIVVGSHESSKCTCIPIVKHFCYRIKNDNIADILQDDCNTLVKINSSQLVLTAEKQTKIEGVNTSDDNKSDIEQNIIPLKLELMNTSFSLSDLSVLTQSCSKCSEGMSDEPSSNYTQRKKGALKRSQSFKESGKYKKAGRGRKFSLGALSFDAQNKIYKEEKQNHNMCFDKLAVERTLARLGPLPPTPSPPQTPLPPSSPPPPLSPATTSPGSLFQQHDQLSRFVNNMDDNSGNSRLTYLPSEELGELQSCRNDERYDKPTEVEINSTIIIDTTIMSPWRVASRNSTSLETAEDGHSTEFEDMNIIMPGNNECVVEIQRLSNEDDKEMCEHDSYYFILENDMHRCVRSENCE